MGDNEGDMKMYSFSVASRGLSPDGHVTVRKAAKFIADTGLGQGRHIEVIYPQGQAA